VAFPASPRRQTAVLKTEPAAYHVAKAKPSDEG